MLHTHISGFTKSDRFIFELQFSIVQSPTIKAVLFNPRATNYNPRIPNSILSIAGSIESQFEHAIVDGNLERDAFHKIEKYIFEGFNVFALSVMPGPQLKQAIPFSKRIRQKYPGVKIVWGGYFASNHSQVVMSSGYVDYVIYGPGDKAFPQLLHALKNNLPVDLIPNLIWKSQNQIIKNHKDELYDQDELPALPYEKLNHFYPIRNYLAKTYLGTKTIAYHSSVGCPFKCAFCGIVPIYNARWKGKSAELICNDVLYLMNNYEGNSVEFHDNNFFVSEKRVAEFSRLIKSKNIVWWGEGRIDTIDKYSDETLASMRESGCKMIFFGAETGNDAILKKMDKGGTQTGKQIKQFAARMAKFDIIPEYSFVLGTPADTEDESNRQIDEDIKFIREIKEINPKTEIIIYVYSPVPTEGSDLYNAVKKAGFNFPQTLEDWVSPAWENFDLRKNPLTPWLKPYMIDKIQNFETVLNGYYPTASDIKLNTFKKKLIRWLSSARYHMHLYKYPYEIKALQKFILRYRQPEIEGF